MALEKGLSFLKKVVDYHAEIKNKKSSRQAVQDYRKRKSNA